MMPGRGRGRYVFAYEKLYRPDHWLAPMHTGESANKRDAWMDMIANANPNEGPDLGTLDWSIRFMAARWNRSPKWVFALLSLLEERGAVERELPDPGKRTPARTRICNYESYQAPIASAGNAKEHAKGNAKEHEDTDSRLQKTSSNPDEPGSPEKPDEEQLDLTIGPERSMGSRRQPSEKHARTAPRSHPPKGRGGWPADFARDFEELTGGQIAPGRLGRELGPLVKRDGEAAVRARWRRWLTEQRERGELEYVSGSHFAKVYGQIGNAKPDPQTGERSNVESYGDWMW